MNALKSSLKLILSLLGYTISKKNLSSKIESFSFPAFLQEYLSVKGHIYIIQIGANDGTSFDPVHDFIKRNSTLAEGILIEPMKDAFEKLTENYKQFPQFTLINAALHNTEKEMTLYRPDPEKCQNLSSWVCGIASFNKNHHELTGTPADCVIAEKVKCMSFGDLIRDFKISKIDLLQIDTEGYDAEIIMGIDFSKILPRIIRFEHGMVDEIMDKETFLRVTRHLNGYGYQVILENYDATAYIIEDFLPVKNPMP